MSKASNAMDQSGIRHDSKFVCQNARRTIHTAVFSALASPVYHTGGSG